MTTEFSALPIVDLSPLSDPNISPRALADVSAKLDTVFRTTGFAYLTNPPLSFSHDEVFGLTREFFSLPGDRKMKAAKKMFVGFDPSHQNTYRGYFPSQSGSPDNLKEGFEIGPGKHEEMSLQLCDQIYQACYPSSRAPREVLSQHDQHMRVKPPTIRLNEANVWPSPRVYPHVSREKLEQLYRELQNLSRQLLSLLAVALGESEYIFDDEGWMDHSISTLRLLHYPPQSETEGKRSGQVKLCCTPHTDSGILTLLHQDPTGGLEVQNARGDWVAAPYLPGSLVVNIGDLMARVSGGRYVATMHRVRAGGATKGGDRMGRFSVPFFFEPGEECLIRSLDGNDEGVRYGEHVRAKMNTWVEFQAKFEA